MFFKIVIGVGVGVRIISHKMVQSNWSNSLGYIKVLKVGKGGIVI